MQGSATIPLASGTNSYVITIAAASTTPSTGGTPFNAAGGPPPTSGKWHIRSQGVATSVAVSLITVAVTDSVGTTTVAVPISASLTLTNGIDLTGEFKTDAGAETSSSTAISSVTFTITTATATTAGSFDAEVSLV
jgi:hypothetical protein